jgi:uncharacterized protein YidB (DUF937 family)
MVKAPQITGSIGEDTFSKLAQFVGNPEDEAEGLASMETDKVDVQVTSSR